MTSITTTTPEAAQVFAQSLSNGQADKAISDLKTFGSQKTTDTDAFKIHARKTAKQFEGMFISQMLSQMFKGLKTDGIFGGGSAEETFRGLMIDEYGKAIAEQGNLGIADHIYREIIQLQDVAEGQQATAQDALAGVDQSSFVQKYKQ
jgi:flagellar protein FlgJ